MLNKSSCISRLSRHADIDSASSTHAVTKRNDHNPSGRSRIKYGMTPNGMGFTLIELLVVVLIIGILASIALPQYQKAVIKAKLSQVTVTVDALKKGINLYTMSAGYEDITVTREPNPLDIEIPGEWNGGDYYISKIGGFMGNIFDEGWAQIVYVSSMVPNGVSEGWFDDTSFVLTVSQEEKQWIVGEVNSGTTNSLAIICQWLKGHGYPAAEAAFANCKESGVILEKFDI